jgi:hypothetical protein
MAIKYSELKVCDRVDPVVKIIRQTKKRGM